MFFNYLIVLLLLPYYIVARCVRHRRGFGRIRTLFRLFRPAVVLYSQDVTEIILLLIRYQKAEMRFHIIQSTL